MPTSNVLTSHAKQTIQDQETVNKVRSLSSLFGAFCTVRPSEINPCRFWWWKRALWEDRRKIQKNKWQNHIHMHTQACVWCHLHPKHKLWELSYQHLKLLISHTLDQKCWSYMKRSNHGPEHICLVQSFAFVVVLCSSVHFSSNKPLGNIFEVVEKVHSSPLSPAFFGEDPTLGDVEKKLFHSSQVLRHQCFILHLSVWVSAVFVVWIAVTALLKTTKNILSFIFHT